MGMFQPAMLVYQRVINLNLMVFLLRQYDDKMYVQLFLVVGRYSPFMVQRW